MTTFQEMIYRAVSLDNVLDLVASGESNDDTARYLRWYIEELERDRDHWKGEAEEAT